eukprot:SAG22_NODE_534_length_9397_cov_22.325231_7_plen_82_part_00
MGVESLSEPVPGGLVRVVRPAGVVLRVQQGETLEVELRLPVAVVVDPSYETPVLGRHRRSRPVWATELVADQMPGVGLRQQ